MLKEEVMTSVGMLAISFFSECLRLTASFSYTKWAALARKRSSRLPWRHSECDCVISIGRMYYNTKF